MIRVPVGWLTIPVCLLLLAGLLFAWPWSRDMVSQPSFGPLEAFYPVPEGVRHRDGRLPVMDRLDADANLHRPERADKASIERGGSLFADFCAPCHGASGMGGGPVSEKFIPPPPLFPLVESRSDGYLYGTMRFGGPIMPSYGQALRDEDIWDITDYLRKNGEGSIGD